MRLKPQHWFAWLLALVAGFAMAQPAELEGVKLQPSVELGGQPLLLNGAGVRKRAAFIKVYVAGLYVPQKSSDAGALLAQKGPRRVALHMLRDVDADTFASALNDGLSSNHSPAQLGALKASIDQLNANFKAIGEAKKGDAIYLDFVPGTGTQIVVNGQARGSAIAGDEFFGALLRIWLGDNPADSGVKKGMLGGG
jgi:hypothetical protein